MNRSAATPGQVGVVGAIAAGGALGSLARYGVSRVIHVSPGSFPWATFWTNVSGSFAFGAVLALLVARFPPSRYLRPFVAVGFIGAYTTFSTMAVETDLLVKDGHAAIGVMYLVVSVAAGLCAAAAGMLAGRAA